MRFTQESRTETDAKTFRSRLFRSQGELAAAATLAGKTGFAPGQEVEVRAEVDNKSSVEIEGMKVGRKKTIV